MLLDLWALLGQQQNTGRAAEDLAPAKFTLGGPRYQVDPRTGIRRQPEPWRAPGRGKVVAFSSSGGLRVGGAATVLVLNATRESQPAPIAGDRRQTPAPASIYMPREAIVVASGGLAIGGEVLVRVHVHVDRHVEASGGVDAGGRAGVVAYSRRKHQQRDELELLGLLLSR